MKRIPFKLSWNIEPMKECDVIVGSQHILIDTRPIQLANLKLYLALFTFYGGFLVFLYTSISKNFLILVVSIFLAVPTTFGLILFWLAMIRGGSASYLLDKDWVTQMQETPRFFIKGIIPAGEPYLLGQYLAKKNIKITDFTSGREAWAVTPYPLPIVEEEFYINVSKSNKRLKKALYASIIASVFLIWLAVHGTYLISNQLLDFFTSKNF